MWLVFIGVWLAFFLVGFPMLLGYFFNSKMEESGLKNVLKLIVKHHLFANAGNEFKKRKLEPALFFMAFMPFIALIILYFLQGQAIVRLDFEESPYSEITGIFASKSSWSKHNGFEILIKTDSGKSFVTTQEDEAKILAIQAQILKVLVGKNVHPKFN
jgi:hypothetical protein